MNYRHGFELLAFMAGALAASSLFYALCVGIERLFRRHPNVGAGTIIAIIIIGIFLLGAVAT